MVKERGCLEMADLRHQTDELLSDNKLCLNTSVQLKRGNKQTQHVICKYVPLKLVFQMLTSVK